MQSYQTSVLRIRVITKRAALDYERRLDHLARACTPLDRAPSTRDRPLQEDARVQ